ncbi:MAG: SusC/RagA family TonB-linked outer membrane protein [Ferruginibacter sp.]
MRAIIFFIMCLATTNMAYTQTIIHGKVTDAQTGGAVAGVSIIALQSKSSTVTADDGSFSLTVNTGKDRLELTHVNYSVKTVSLNAATPTPLLISIQQTSKELDEVIVNTGYQQLPKERATGSFNLISNKLYNEQTGTNVLERLEGISNGLIFDRKAGNNSNANIVIRGLSTIQGPKAPLVILDNFPYDGDINNINPNDVDNISILKDAAAASIWGTRAGNGVIVITTKKGRFSQPVRIQVNSNVTVGAKPDLFYLPEIAPGDFADLEEFLYNKGFFNSAINSKTRPPLSPVVELLKQAATGVITPAEAQSRIDLFKQHDLRTDFSDYVYSPSVNQQYNINMQGGEKNIAWSFSAGLDNNRSNLSDKYNRINLRSNNNFRITKNLQLRAGLFYTQSNSTLGKPGYGQLNTSSGNLPVYTQLADANGNSLPVIKQYRQAYLDTVGGGRLLDWNFYPLEDYQHVDNTNTLQDVTGNLAVEYTVTKGLQASVQYQYERQSGNGRILYDEASYFTRNLVNSFTQFNSQGNAVYNVPKGSIIDNNNTVLVAHNIRGQLNYHHQQKNGELNALAGAEVRNSHTTGNSSRAYGYSDDILTFGNVDYFNNYPNLVSQNSQFIPNGAGFTDKLNRYVSYFANAAYTWREKYTVSASGRRDGSNLFGVDYNQKTVPLWSVGAGWDIQKESFYKSAVFSYLHLRTTYGVSGNADPSRSALTTIAYGLNSSYTQTPVARVDQYANPSLRWEKVKMLNVGLDFKTSGNRLSGSIEYFHKKATDLFGTSIIDYTGTGINYLLKNSATIQGNGIDIALNSVNVQGAFTWSTNLNLSYNKETVSDYYLPAPEIINFTSGGSNISGIKGRPVYALYGYKWAGLDPATGDPQGIYEGQVSKDYNNIFNSTILDDLVYKGSAIPVVSGNVGNTIGWKNISLTVRLLYKFGYWFQRTSINYSNLYTSRQGNSDYALRWQQPGDEANTNVPSLPYPRNSSRDNFYRGSEILIEKGDQVRLQYITLGYELKHTNKNKLPFASMQFYVTASNLGILWRANKKGIDPDYYRGLPPGKIVSVGLRANF